MEFKSQLMNHNGANSEFCTAFQCLVIDFSIRIIEKSCDNENNLNI